MVKFLSYCFILLCLTACGSFRPLYGPTPDGLSVSSSLSEVNVAEQRTRTGQLIRNEIVSGSDGVAKFELKLVISESIGGVSATPGTVIYRKRLNITVNYDLLELATGSSMTKGKSFANVSFDTVREPIADLQAAEAARSRAASQIGQDLKQRLAAYFATKRVN